MRILSGIQPTGRFHWGNYFGAIRQYIALQDGNEAYYFIANLHALTTVRDPERLRQATLDAALDLLALGLDPARATLFVQSDVPEVSELCWLLMTGTPMGLLERCVAFKEKKAKGIVGGRRAVHLPGADGGRHPGLRRGPRSGRARTRCSTSRSAAIWRGVSTMNSAKCSSLPRATVDGELGEGSRHRRREDVEELRQHDRDLRRAGGSAQEDDAHHDRFAADGAVRRNRRPTTCTSCTRCLSTRRSSDEMASLYRRGGFGYGTVKKELAAVGRAVFQRGPCAPQGTGSRSGACASRSWPTAPPGAPQGFAGPAPCQQACGIPAR